MKSDFNQPGDACCVDLPKRCVSLKTGRKRKGSMDCLKHLLYLGTSAKNSSHKRVDTKQSFYLPTRSAHWQSKPERTWQEISVHFGSPVKTEAGILSISIFICEILARWLIDAFLSAFLQPKSLHILVATHLQRQPRIQFYGFFLKTSQGVGEG